MMFLFYHILLLLLLCLLSMELTRSEALKQTSIDGTMSRRIRSSNETHPSTGRAAFPQIFSVSVDDYFVVLQCSTEERVSHYILDWYFQSSADKSPRVIWQRGRSNIHRYTAYSPDQRKHYLQIKPVYPNDTGLYICIDQSSGDEDRVELVVRDSHSCAASRIHLQETMLVSLFLLIWLLSRRTSSESEVT